MSPARKWDWLKRGDRQECLSYRGWRDRVSSASFVHVVGALLAAPNPRKRTVGPTFLSATLSARVTPRMCPVSHRRDAEGAEVH